MGAEGVPAPDTGKEATKVSRKAVRLTLDHLADLPEEPRTCLRWKLDAVARSRVDEEEREVEVEAWLSEVLREWGSCGRVVTWDGEAVGAVLYAPGARLPGLAELPTAPPSPDAVVMTDLWVAPEARNAGVGRMLIQAMARDLFVRQVNAVEAFGTHGTGTEGCLLPAEFLGAVGFKTHRAHGTTPRMRMELRTARTWLSEVELAVERLVGAVRPALKPGVLKPSAFESSGGVRETGTVPRSDEG